MQDAQLRCPASYTALVEAGIPAMAQRDGVVDQIVNGDAYYCQKPM